eukprot:scaffold898_cov229-Pinguiococcus_pyrenoidosus.AAC.12
MPIYGQVVLGPPGSGKSTYCAGMAAFLEGQLDRSVAVVNMDPGNDQTPYPASVDVRELLDAGRVMSELSLGPNGAQVFCMEELESNVDWLVEQLRPFDAYYLLLDCPGQVELHTHHESLRNLLHGLTKQLDLRLTAVHLVDAVHVVQPATFVAATLTSLTAMLRLELPHVNVLSKVDLLKTLAPEDLPYSLQYFADVSCLRDLAGLVGRSPASPWDGRKGEEEEGEEEEEEGEEGRTDDEQRRTPKSFVHAERYRRLNAAISEAIEDFGLVSYTFLSIDDGETLGRVIAAVDKANGYNMIASMSSKGAQYDEMVRAQGPPSSIEHLVGDIEDKYLPGATDEDSAEEAPEAGRDTLR